MRAALITSLFAAILIVPSAAHAEVAAECPAHLIRWLEQCQAETDLDVEPVSCPRGILRLRLRPSGGESLDVEVNAEPERAFRAAGRLGVSPILEVSDFSDVPEVQRRAFEAFVTWVGAHDLSLTASDAAPPPRSPEPLLPERLERPTWLSVAIALLTLFLVVLYVRRGRREATTSEDEAEESDRPTAGPLWQRALWAAGVLFVGAMGAGLLRAPAGVTLHVDTLRDLLIVREWVEGPTSVALGSVSSTGLYHGFLWHRILAAWQVVDPSLTELNPAISTAMALSILLLYLVVEARTSRGLALVAAAAVALVTVGSSTLWTPLWQPTLNPELSSLIVCAAALEARSGPRRRVVIILVAAAIAMASQVHLIFLLLLPGLILTARKDLWIAAPAVAGVVFVAWDVLSHDSLGADLAMLVSGSRVDAIAGGAQSQPDWHVAVVICLAIISCGLWIVGRARRWLSGGDSPLAILNAMLAGYVVCGLVLFGPRALVLRYWVPALIVTITALAVMAHLLLARRQRAIHPWIGGALFVVSILVVASQGRVRDGAMTLEDLDAVAGALEREGIGAEEAFRAVTAAPPLSEAFERGIWLKAPCQRSARRLGLREVDRHFLLLAGGEGRQIPELPGLRVVTSGDRQFGLLTSSPYVETADYRVCLRGEDRCYRGDRSFPNAGFEQMCFVGDWGSSIDAALARETREVDVELEVTVPAGGGDHVLFIPSIDGQGGRAACRGDVVSVEGVLADRREGGLLLRGSSEAQRGRLRVRWPWHDGMCRLGSRQRPMPVIELDSEAFTRLRPFLEAAP